MSYPGSKAQAGTWQRIIGQMPPHRIYVEAFAGSAQVFLRKRRAAINVLIERDPAVSADLDARIRGAAVLNGDALIELAAPELDLGDTITLTLGDDALVYCDPPYLLETRRNRRYYEHELSDEQHRQLLALLQGLKCKVMLSGYPSELYGTALQNWRCLSYQTRTRGRTLTECLWMNFEEPAALHDWRYTGRTYRERQSLSKLRRRWLARLQRMTARHRGFILDAIAQRQF